MQVSWDGDARRILTWAIPINKNLLRVHLKVGGGFRDERLQATLDPIEEIVDIRKDVKAFGFW